MHNSAKECIDSLYECKIAGGLGPTTEVVSFYLVENFGGQLVDYFGRVQAALLAAEQPASELGDALACFEGTIGDFISAAAKRRTRHDAHLRMLAIAYSLEARFGVDPLRYYARIEAALKEAQYAPLLPCISNEKPKNSGKTPIPA